MTRNPEYSYIPEEQKNTVDIKSPDGIVTMTFPIGETISYTTDEGDVISCTVVGLTDDAEPRLTLRGSDGTEFTLSGEEAIEHLKEPTRIEGLHVLSGETGTSPSPDTSEEENKANTEAAKRKKALRKRRG